MIRIVPHAVPRVGLSYEPFADGFELHLLHFEIQYQIPLDARKKNMVKHALVLEAGKRNVMNLFRDKHQKPPLAKVPDWDSHKFGFTR